MRVARLFAACLAVLLVPALAPAVLAQPKGPTIDQFLGAAYPLNLVAARKAERLAWVAYDRGQRNVYTAVAPGFRPVRLTTFLEDNGVDLTSLRISDDGAVVVFVRGYTLGREERAANPTSDVGGASLTIWAARTAGGPAWRLCEGTNPVLSPDGRFVLFTQAGQIYRAPITQAPRTSAIDKGEKPFIIANGTNGAPQWSPDGRKIAFISDRVDHSFIGVYDVKTRKLTFLSPSVDRDTSPTWSPDSKQIAFIRRPGLPFGQQAQQGSGGIGNPPGPAYNPNAPQGRGGRGGGAFAPQPGQAGQRGQAPSPVFAGAANVPGLTRAAFAGGYSVSFWVADAASGDAHEFWHPAQDATAFMNINAIQWAGDRVMFTAQPDEWLRFFTVPVAGSAATPALVTPDDGFIEGAAFTSLSADGRTLYYCTNFGDIDRRDVWKVSTAGDARPVQLTRGDDIETYPVPLPSGRVAVLTAGVRRPQSVGVIGAAGGQPSIIFPTLPKDFPTNAHVVPENVLLKAPDGIEFHNQLFVPKDLKAGDKRPAIVFVHGGPVRQMLLGYHYMHVYHMFYAANQWLASQGYVVLSVNYRLGVGYGRSFQSARNAGAAGNAEYQDVVAAARYLQGRPDVDPKRVGIWGLSYGGLLTSQALARNSDIFIAGVDMAGVHLYTNVLDPENVAYKSSAISAISGWKSPVLLVHGDDDRNVAFTQTTGLVQLLRAHNVYHELIVFPDDVHEPLTHGRFLYVFHRMDAFLAKFLRDAGRTTD
ncbi:MAG: S9 family peptidase [Bacteroidales bacterium]